MGRKMKMNQINEKEYDWILGVIHRDFDLRKKEQERLNKIESELNEAANQRSILAKRKEFNEKCCILCCSAFNLLFNKKLLCGNCQFLVCRNCATWESQEKTWLCRVCDQQRSLYIQSCEWFYEHIQRRFQCFGSAKILDQLRRKKRESGVDSENDSGYGPAFYEGNYFKESPVNLQLLLPGFHNKVSDPGGSTDVPGIDAGSSEETITENKDISEVRQHIETVIEGLVGETLDNSRVDRPFSHPLYLQLFSNFHNPLVDAMLKLRQALETALLKKPPVGDVSPTTAHATLKHIIVDIGEKVAALPCLEKCSPEKYQNNSGISNFMDSCIFQSYEGLLASAVINKLVDQSQKLQYGKSGRDSSHSDLSTSDNDLILKNKSSGILNHSMSSSDSERDSDLETGSLGGVDAGDEFSWATSLGSAAPPKVEYVIEERIEEITQEEFADEDNSTKNSSKSYETSRKSCKVPLTKTYSSVDEEPVEKNIIGSPQNIPELDFLNAWDIVDSHRVPFPEFGVDIIDNTIELNDENDDCDTDDEATLDVGSRQASVTAWEENWLFRKKKLFPFGSLRHQLLGFYGESPCLLIPNSQENNSHAQIDSRDIDQMSDLSEQNSVGTLDFSDSNGESDSEVKSTGSAELVRLAQNVAQHFSNVAQEPYTEVPRRTSTVQPNPNKTVQKKPLNITHMQSRDAENTIQPPGITLPIPSFVDVERRQKCVDPTFISTPENATVHAGKVANFTCQVKGARPIRVSWFRECQLIKDDQRDHIQELPEKGKYLLSIFDTDAGDTGIYSCVAYGQAGGQQWTDFSLKIKASTRADSPPEFIVPLRVVSSVPEQSSKLSCTLNGYPEPRVMFFHNRKPIALSAKYIIENNGYGEWTLEISNLSQSDDGGYEVVASNRMGHAVSSVTHRTGEVKNPPHILTENVEKKVDSKKVTKGIFGNHSNNLNGNAYSKNEMKQPANLSSPPKPGTIAEREHRKWENAAPLRNNPYSKENITKKKLERRMSDLSLSDSPMTFEEFAKQREEDEVILGRTGLGHSLEKEYKRYKRDYYIHDSNSSGTPSPSLNSRPANKPPKVNGVKLKPNNVIHKLEEKVYESASQLISLDDEVQQLEEEVRLRANDLHGVAELENRVAQALAEEENACRKVFQVESEVKQIKEKRELLRKSSVCSSSSEYSNQGNPARLPSSNSKQSYFISSDEDVNSALPSVKKLANLFVDPNLEKSNGHQVTKHYLDDDKEIIIVESDVSSSSNNQNSPLSSLQHTPGVSALSQQFLAAPSTKYQVEPHTQNNMNYGENRDSSNINKACPNSTIKLPIVKLLTQQFTNDDQSGASVQRVHSLTARSLSKEFRQLTQRNVPRPMNRTLSISSSSQPTSLDTDGSLSPMVQNYSNGDNNLSYSPTLLASENERDVSVSPAGGYTSDESSATSNPSSSLPRQKSKRSSMSKTILQRASYWERRAEQGLLSDNSVNEEFPSIDPEKKNAKPLN